MSYGCSYPPAARMQRAAQQECTRSELRSTTLTDSITTFKYTYAAAAADNSAVPGSTAPMTSTRLTGSTTSLLCCCRFAAAAAYVRSSKRPRTYDQHHADRQHHCSDWVHQLVQEDRQRLQARHNMTEITLMTKVTCAVGCMAPLQSLGPPALQEDRQRLQDCTSNITNTLHDM